MNTLKREDAKWMKVWNDNHANKNTRLVVIRFKSGECIAVNDGEEDDFIYGLGGVGFIHWGNCEPIPEKKKRFMTDAEIFKAIREGAVIKDRHGIISNYWESTCWHGSYNKSYYKICYNYTGANDKWEPLEVEEC